jgi:hypothetical protein
MRVKITLLTTVLVAFLAGNSVFPLEKDEGFRFDIQRSDHTVLRASFELTDYRSWSATSAEGTISRAFLLPSHSQAQLKILNLEKILQDNIDVRADWSRNEHPLISISAPVKARNLAFSAIDIAPYQYLPEEKRWEVVKRIDFEIAFLPSNIEKTLRKNPIRANKFFLRGFTQDFLNSSLLDEEMDNVDGEGAYLFILPDSSLTNILQPLIDWRLERGFSSSLAFLSNIGNTAVELKEYIQDAYNTWDNPPQYVVLIGDIDGTIAVPCFYYHPSAIDSFPSDLPYSLLEGNDYFPDLDIGRISVRDPVQLSIIVDKIVNYESEPPIIPDDNWFGRGLVSADTSAQMALSVKQWSAEIMLDNGYEAVDSMFFFTYMPIPAVTSIINQGVGLFNYRGWSDWGGFATININLLSNGEKHPVLFGCAGGTNNISQTECMGEAWLRGSYLNLPSAGISAIGPSAVNTMSKWDGTFDQGMMWGLLQDNLYRPAALIDRAILELWLCFPWDRGPGNTSNSVECYAYAYNLLGDPGLSIWTSEPLVISAVHSDSIPLGQNSIDISASDSSGALSEALAVMLFGNELIASGYTDNSGNVELQLPASQAGNLTLTITAQNHLPYQTQIPIISTPQYLSCVNAIIDDDSLGFSNGNGDGVLNPGEMVELNLMLTNFGTVIANNAWAIISSSDSNLNIFTPTQPYGVILPWGSSVNTIPFLLGLMETVVENAEITLNVEARDILGGVYGSQWILPLATPNAEVISYDFPAAPQDTLLLPGMNTDMILTLHNSGGCAWGTMTMTAHSGLEGVVFSDSVSIIPPVSAGGTFTTNIDRLQVSVASLIFPGLQAPMIFTFQTAGGWRDTVEIVVPIANVTIFDPVISPDGYYYCFDNGDISYENAPQYQWLEIDPDFGGSGTAIPLVDAQAFNGDSELLNLPQGFTFRYYGESFEQMTICSNGWMACGSVSGWEYRNKPIPAAGEPMGMIAPFWDDLMLTSGGEVYYRYDSTLSVFIVEWSRVRNVLGSQIETFEVVLWDAETYPTPTGDSPISFIYNTINDVDTLNNYSTVGILNNEGDGGLQYVYSDIYSPGAVELDDHLALYFTTEPGVRSAPPALSYNPTSYNFVLPVGGSMVDTLTLSNTGETDLTYNLEVNLWEPDNSGGPDQFGYIWIDSDEPNGRPFNWIDISEIGTEIIFPHNDSTSANLMMGFNFPFYGINFPYIIVSANGWCSFSSHGSYYNNTILPSTSAPPNCIAGFWDDLNPVQPAGGGRVFYWGNQTDSMIVSFVSVEKYNAPMSQYTFQFIITSDGQIALQYLQMIGILNSATIGTQNNNRTIGLTINYNQTYVHNNLRIDIQRRWLNLSQYGGIIPGDSTHNISASVLAINIPPGTYNCDISLSTNDPNNMNITIPVSLTVTAGDFMVPNVNIQVSNGLITLNWEALMDVDLYRIFRYSAPYQNSFGGEYLGQTVETTFIDSTGWSGGKYFYRVMGE